MHSPSSATAGGPRAAPGALLKKRRGQPTTPEIDGGPQSKPEARLTMHTRRRKNPSSPQEHPRPRELCSPSGRKTFRRTGGGSAHRAGFVGDDRGQTAFPRCNTASRPPSVAETFSPTATDAAPRASHAVQASHCYCDGFLHTHAQPAEVARSKPQSDLVAAAAPACSKLPSTTSRASGADSTRLDDDARQRAAASWRRQGTAYLASS